MQNKAFKTYLLFLVTYALRNTQRNLRRSLLIVATVAFAVSIVNIASGYSKSIVKLWQSWASDTGSAHSQIHKTGYWAKQEGVDIDLTLGENNLIEDSLARDKDVAHFARRLKVEGMITTDTDSLFFKGIGVNPDSELKVSPKLFTNNDRGRFLTQANRSEVVIGPGLASGLGLDVGSEATLIAQTARGSVNAVDVVVVGIVDMGLPGFSKRSLFANVEHFQRLLRIGPRYSEIAVKLKNDESIDDWVRLKSPWMKSKGVELMGWWRVEPMIKAVEDIWDSVILIITALLFFSASMSILNMISMMVNERTIEIGTLGAIGARDIDIYLLLSFEAGFLGLLGSITGTALGYLAVAAMNISGMPFDSPFGGSLIVHPHFSLKLAVITFVVGITITMLASILPALKATRVEPTVAFRNQLN